MCLDYRKIYTPWNQALKIPIYLKAQIFPCLFGGLLTCNYISNVAAWTHPISQDWALSKRSKKVLRKHLVLKATHHNQGFVICLIFLICPTKSPLRSEQGMSVTTSCVPMLKCNRRDNPPNALKRSCLQAIGSWFSQMLLSAYYEDALQEHEEWIKYKEI